jgi:S1-C subfamily serine protease
MTFCSRALVTLAILLAGLPTEAVSNATGSGFVIGKGGQILTAAHVVSNCTSIQVRQPLTPAIAATVVAKDMQNDIALLHVNRNFGAMASLRTGTLRTGEPISIVGYPLAGLLSTEPNLTTGVVSAAAGLSDDVRFVQITAPVQPGNSGGPVLDSSGHLVGLVTSKLDFRVAIITGALPENVNFALKSEMIALFLNSFGVPFSSTPSNRTLSTAGVVDLAKQFAVLVSCNNNNRVAAALSRRAKPARTNPSNWRHQIQPGWFSH